MHVVTEEGPEWRAGRDRRELALRGPLSEIVLWLSGRDASVGVDAAGPSALADALHDRLRI